MGLTVGWGWPRPFVRKLCSQETGVEESPGRKEEMGGLGYRISLGFRETLLRNPTFLLRKAYLLRHGGKCLVQRLPWLLSLSFWHSVTSEGCQRLLRVCFSPLTVGSVRAELWPTHL